MGTQKNFAIYKDSLYFAADDGTKGFGSSRVESHRPQKKLFPNCVYALAAARLMCYRGGLSPR